MIQRICYVLFVFSFLLLLDERESNVLSLPSRCSQFAGYLMRSNNSIEARSFCCHSANFGRVRDLLVEFGIQTRTSTDVLIRRYSSVTISGTHLLCVGCCQSYFHRVVTTIDSTTLRTSVYWSRLLLTGGRFRS